MENVYGILDVKEEASLQKHLNLMHWHVLIFLSLHHHASDSVLRFGKRCKSSARRTCCASSRSTVPTLAIQQVEEESTSSWFEGPSSCCQIKNQNRFASNLPRDVAAKSINAHIALEKHCQSVYTKLKMDYAPAIEPPLSSNDTNKHFCVWCLELSSLSRLRSQLLLPADCNYLKAVQTELVSKAAATSRNQRKTHYDLTIRFFSCNECILCSFVHLQPGTLRPTQKRPVWLRKHWAKMKAHKARHLTMKNVQSLIFPTFICLSGWPCKAERTQTCSWHFPFAASLSCDPAEWTCKLSVCVCLPEDRTSYREGLYTRLLETSWGYWCVQNFEAQGYYQCLSTDRKDGYCQGKHHSLHYSSSGPLEYARWEAHDRRRSIKNAIFVWLTFCNSKGWIKLSVYYAGRLGKIHLHGVPCPQAFIAASNREGLGLQFQCCWFLLPPTFSPFARRSTVSLEMQRPQIQAWSNMSCLSTKRILGRLKMRQWTSGPVLRHLLLPSLRWTQWHSTRKLQRSTESKTVDD